jgi:hypothetical protein
VAVGLVAGHLAAVGAGDDGEDRLALVENVEAGLVDVDGDGLAGVRQSHLDALPADLDGAAFGDASLNTDWPVRCAGWRAGQSGAADAAPVWDGMGSGMVRQSSPSAMTCSRWSSRRSTTRCPARGRPTLTWTPARVISPQPFTDARSGRPHARLRIREIEAIAEGGWIEPTE